MVRCYLKKTFVTILSFVQFLSNYKIFIYNYCMVATESGNQIYQGKIRDFQQSGKIREIYKKFEKSWKNFQMVILQ